MTFQMPVPQGQLHLNSFSALKGETLSQPCLPLFVAPSHWALKATSTAFSLTFAGEMGCGCFLTETKAAEKAD